MHKDLKAYWLWPLLLACGLAAATPGSDPRFEAAAQVQRWLETRPAEPWPDGLLLGEQHDAPEHQQLAAALTQVLASRGELAALALEMVDQGHHTRSLPPDASESAVRQALHWADQGWPWEAYGPVVMAAVRAGVVVHGANLPRQQNRQAMQTLSWDLHLAPAAMQAQRQAIAEGHCGLLPESQLQPMLRIQLARDAAMADTLLALRQPGKTVLLLAGAAHVRRDLGLPTHIGSLNQARLHVVRLQAGAGPAWPQGVADEVWTTPAVAARDYCAELRGRLRQ